MNEITAYECEHCHKKIYRCKSSAKKHERICFFNMETKSCVTCEKFSTHNNGSRSCYDRLDIEATLRTNCKNYVPSFIMLINKP